MKPTKPSRVLVPIDNSKNSWRVIDHAITFAKTTGADYRSLCSADHTRIRIQILCNTARTYHHHAKF